MYSGLSGERSGRHCVYDHAEVFDGPGRGEVGFLRVYHYAQGAAECEELVDVMSCLGLRGGQDQPVVQVS